MDPKLDLKSADVFWERVMFVNGAWGTMRPLSLLGLVCVRACMRADGFRYMALQGWGGRGFTVREKGR